MKLRYGSEDKRTRKRTVQVPAAVHAFGQKIHLCTVSRRRTRLQQALDFCVQYVTEETPPTDHRQFQFLHLTLFQLLLINKLL